MRFGERLKQLREGKFSQEQLAELLRVHNNTISKWENGLQEPRAKRIAELARILNTTSAYLLGDSDNPSLESEIPTKSLISHTKQQSSKEHSENHGMLVYETRDGERFEAPPTEEGIKYIERMLNANIRLSAKIAQTTTTA